MSRQENEKIVRELMETINKKDPDKGLRLIADDCEFVDVPFDVTRRGPEGWKESYNFWISAFPDGKVDVTRIIATDTNAVVEYTGSGTHEGPLKTPEGDITPTGRRIQTQFCDVCEVRNGKIANIRSYFDAASVMRQLGVLPEPAVQR